MPLSCRSSQRTHILIGSHTPAVPPRRSDRRPAATRYERDAAGPGCFQKLERTKYRKKKKTATRKEMMPLVAACTWTGLLDMHLASSPFSLRRPAALHAACTACRAGCDEPLVRTVACAPGGARRSERTKTSAISFLQHAPPDSDPAAFTSSSRRQRRTMQA